VLRSLRRAAAAAFVLAGVAAATCRPAAAGYVFVDDSGDQTLLAAGRVKMIPKRADAPTFVLDMRRARVWVANPGRRTFWEGTIEEYCTSVKSLVGGAMAGMEEQLKSLPPAERAQVEALMKSMGRGPATGGVPANAVRVAVERTAETDTIAGWPTRKYRVLADGRLHEEVWLSADAGVARELDGARAPQTFGRMIACMMAGPSPASGVEDSAEYRQLYALDGRSGACITGRAARAAGPP
jgi:hypothetical protein